MLKMQVHRNRNGILTNVVLFLAIFDSYCQMAPAAAGNARQFELGSGHSYKIENTVLLNEGGPKVGKDVGYQLSGELTIGSLWQNPDNLNDKLLKLQLISPVLHIKSRKAPAPEGFVSHASKLENMNNGAFYIHWTSGKIDNIYIEKDEEHSMVNLKKGIASLFQFQLLDLETTEKDASGKCIVTYKTLDSHTFRKTKKDCVSGKTVPFIKHPDKVMGTNVTSLRKATYQLSKDLSVLRSVMMEESHEMSIVMRQEASTAVRATQEITLTDVSIKLKVVDAGSIEKAVRKVEENSGRILNKMILVTEREPTTCVEDCPSLHKLVKDNHNFLKNENVGTIRSAAAFVKLLSTARESTKDQIAKVLNSSKNKDILMQLMDLAAATQTRESHAAAMSVLQLDSANNQDLCERYFWALSVGSHPNLEVIKDVLKLTSKDNVQGDKLKETIVLTVAAMANKFRKLPGNGQHKVLEEVKNNLLSKLKECKTEECKQKLLRGLQNLGFIETVPTLLGHALTGTRKTSVTAMKALQSFPSTSWDDTVKKASVKIYHQLGKSFDSSSRTLALDILLESNPSQEVLRDLIWSLKSNDPSYEVKQYLLQRLRQVSAKDVDFGKRVKNIMHGECRLNNYNVLAQKGISTALTTLFMSGPDGSGSLVSMQEASSGLPKRAIVDTEFNTAGDSQSVFKLGIFAGGLGSFISSEESTATSDEPEEAATAGMELAVLGVQIRPFVFFSGQGELMGHVWSGAGSEKTPAYQTLALLHDHLQYVPLQTGFVAELKLFGGVSLDLSGQIQLSLWNRNAHSLVEEIAGLSIQGLTKVDTSFVRSQVEFTLTTEGRMNLVSDVDFSSTVSLCLQLQQPSSIVKHNVFKVERIPGSKHRLRKSKYRILNVSGRTYALNRRNNEMCNIALK